MNRTHLAAAVALSAVLMAVPATLLADETDPGGRTAVQVPTVVCDAVGDFLARDGYIAARGEAVSFTFEVVAPAPVLNPLEIWRASEPAARPLFGCAGSVLIESPEDVASAP